MEKFEPPENPCSQHKNKEGTIGQARYYGIEYGKQVMQEAIEAYLGCSIEEAKERLEKLESLEQAALEDHLRE